MRFEVPTFALAALALSATPAHAEGEAAPEVPKAPAAAAPQAPEKTAEIATAEDVRAAQVPSPGGSSKPLAVIVDRPDFQLAVRGYGQFYAGYAQKDALVAAGDPLEFSGLRVRRLQLGVEGKGPKDLSFGIWLDLAANPALSQAWLAWAPMAEFAVEAGVVRVPFSRSALQSSADTTFSERPLAVDKLLPDRQPGIAAYGAIAGGLVTYRAGWFNGAAPERMGTGPDHTAGLFAGRIAVSPLGRVSASQSDLERGPLRFELAVDAMRNDGPSFTGTSLGADLTLQVAGFALLGEYIHDTRAPLNEPITSPTISDTVVRTGYIGQASYQVWGPLEVAFRGEMVDDNTAIDDVGDVLAIAGGVHANFANLRAGLDWYHRAEKFGVALANDTAIGSLQGRF